MRSIVATMILLLLQGATAADDAPALVASARAALTAGKFTEAIDLANKAAAADPKNADAPFVRGQAHSGLRQQEAAVKDFTAALALDPKRAIALDRRGDAYLKNGQFKEAIADFDEFLKTRPELAADHWRRGIALYYAGRYADGVKQFELHRKVNAEDVENSAWHYLCNARATSLKNARNDLIPVSKDSRVPMKQVLELYAGKLQPGDVLDAAEKAKLGDEAKKEARFYANLYVALYYEADGDAKKAFEHLTTAVEKYEIGHYMWDVAKAHLAMLKAKK